MPINFIKDQTNEITLPHMRLETTSLLENRIILDCYNANPQSVKQAICSLAEYEVNPKKRWICLGDMLDLGKKSHQYHAQLGLQIINSDISSVFLLGEHMQFLYNALKNNPNFKGEIQYFRHKNVLKDKLNNALKKTQNITLLIKGSRDLKMEDILL